MYSNIFDTHSHYTDYAFIEDSLSLLDDIHMNKGVKLVMCATVDIQDSINALKLANQRDYIYCSAGIHPENLDNLEKDYIQTIESLIVKNSDKIKSIGEIGLDYHYEGYNAELQREVFRNQMQLAKKLNLPVIIHSRNACEDTLEILKEYQGIKGVMHCYSYSHEVAKDILKLGYHISFTGVITFKNSKKAIKSLEVVPMDKLMLETDCPYMSPEPFRGQRCDSSMIYRMAEKVAEVKGLEPQQVLDITYQNGLNFFNIKKD
ncbi:MAG: TatD family hydrolase [Ruminococcus sp.]|nr:TatD family hydrolase [Ruminococcus sp.]